MGCGFSESTSRVIKSESPDTGRVKSKHESMEYRAFRKCFADLAGASGILDPRWLADQLFSRELIGPDLRREAHNQAVEVRVRIERLLSAVEDQIVASPTTKFREFLDVLQNEPSLQQLATRLENTYHELSGLCTPTSISSTPPLNQSSPIPKHPMPSPLLTSARLGPRISQRYVSTFPIHVSWEPD